MRERGIGHGSIFNKENCIKFLLMIVLCFSGLIVQKCNVVNEVSYEYGVVSRQVDGYFENSIILFSGNVGKQNMEGVSCM